MIIEKDETNALKQRGGEKILSFASRWIFSFSQLKFL